MEKERNPERSEFKKDAQQKSPDVRRDAGKKSAESKPGEERAEPSKKASQQKYPDQKRDAQRKDSESKTQDERSEKGWETRTDEKR